jgi:hypothetical protein
MSDVYRSLATVLTSASSSSPITAVASQLSTASSREQKAELSRILAELLHSQPTHNAGAARKVLYEYIKNLISADLDGVSDDLKLAVELADEGLLLEISEETILAVERLLKRATEVHVSSDDAYAVDFGDFVSRHIDRDVQRVVTVQEVELDREAGVHDAVVHLLRFWHFVFMLPREQSVQERLSRRLGEVMPVRLLAVMAQRNFQVAKGASNVLCCLVGSYHEYLPGETSEVLRHVCRSELKAFILNAWG